MATNYSINYEDERFKSVENEKQQRLDEVNNMYNNMINQSDAFYQNQIDAVKDYSQTQQDLQNQQTDLAINEINQAKEKAEKDYLKEQRGAYTDWQKQSNQYGVNAEQRASSGLGYTGYSESSQVAMYNQYQNRVATARDGYNLAVQNYDNKIAEARLQNNSKLAEIAYNSLQQELELSLNGFQYKNNLLQTQVNMQQDINNTYYNRWQNVLAQMNTENALAEQIRQYNEKMAYQKERDKVADKQWQKEYDLAKKAKRASGGGSRSSSKGSATLPSGSSTKTDKVYTSTATPLLSSKKAQDFFTSLDKNGHKVAESTLKSQLSTAYKNKTINESDVSKILKVYGAS